MMYNCAKGFYCVKGSRGQGSRATGCGSRVTAFILCYILLNYFQVFNCRNFIFRSGSVEQ